jgi:hypothetical protein
MNTSTTRVRYRREFQKFSSRPDGSFPKRVSFLIFSLRLSLLISSRFEDESLEHVYENQKGSTWPRRRSGPTPNPAINPCPATTRPNLSLSSSDAPRVSPSIHLTSPHPAKPISARTSIAPSHVSHAQIFVLVDPFLFRVRVYISQCPAMVGRRRHRISDHPFGN